jgi:hypothetical protein
MTTPQTDTKPNGPVAAAFVAAGIAALVLGIFVTLNEFSPDINNFLKFDANFGLGKGSLQASEATLQGHVNSRRRGSQAPLQNRQVDVMLLIPADFQKQLSKGERPTVKILGREGDES